MADSPGGVEIGRGYVRVVPDVSRVEPDTRKEIRRLEKELGISLKVSADTDPLQRGTERVRQQESKRPVKVPVDPVTTEFQSRLRRDLQAIVRSVDANVPVNADTEKLRRAVSNEVRAIEALMKVDLDADVTIAASQRAQLEAQIAQLSRDVNVHIPVETDTAKATAEMSVWRGRQDGKSIDIPVRVNTAGATAALGVLTGASFGVAGLGAATSQLVGLAGALSQVAGVAGLVPVALFGVAAAAGVIALSLGSVVTALKAFGTQQDQSAQQATQAAAAYATAYKQREAALNAVSAAERELQSANQAANQTAEDGARRVAAAEQNLADAQLASKLAQQDLTRAREDAKTALEDLQLQTSGAALDEKGAEIALARAKERLDSLAGTSTPLDRAEAELAVQQAEQRLTEARKRAKDLAAENAAAQKAGVNGSAQVKAANDAIAQSARNLRDAEAGVGTARRDAANALAQSTQRVMQAQANLAQSQADLNRTQADNNAKITAATSKLTDYEKALQKLSPAGRALVDQILSQRSAWQGLQLGVQETALSGVGAAVGRLASSALPVLSSGLQAVARPLNGVVLSMLQFLGSDRALSALSTAFQGVGDFVAAIGTATQPVMGALLDIISVGGSLGTTVGQQVAGLLTSISQSVSTAASNGSLASFIQGGVDALFQFIDILGNLGSILGSVFGAAQIASGGFLTNLVNATDGMSTFLASADGQAALVSFFQSLNDLSAAIAPLFGTLVTVLGTDLAPLLSTFAVSLAPGVQDALKGIGYAFVALQPVAAPLGKAIGDILTTLAPVLPDIARALGAILLAAAPLAKELVERLAPILSAVAGFIEDNATWLVPLAIGLGAAIGVTSGLATVTGFLGLAMNALPVFAIIAAIALLAAGLIYAYKHSETFRNIVDGAFAYVLGTAKQLGDFFFSTLPNAIKTGVNWIIGSINSVLRALNSILGFEIKLGGFSFRLGGGIQLPEIPQLATGGLTKGRTLATIGEAGQEAVLPLTNADSMRRVGEAIAKAGGSGTADASGLEAAVTRALSGWTVQIDERGVARMVRRVSLMDEAR